MSADKTNDINNEFEDDFSHDDSFDDLGDLKDDQLDDYDLSDTEEESSAEPTEENSESLPHEEGAPLEDLPLEKPSKKGIVDLVKENWLFVGIGVVVIAIVAYLIYGVISPNNSAPAAAPQQQTQGSFQLPQQQAQQQQAAPSQTAGATQANQPAGAASTQTTAAATMQPIASPSETNIVMSEADMKTLMKGFQNMVERNSASIQTSLQTIEANTNQANSNTQAINAIQSQFGDLSKKITSYNQNLAAVDKRLDTLQGELGVLLAQQTAQDEQLTLRAVVPGRAWLVDGKGRTISVVEGSQLGNFGTVTDIDVADGEVKTSSGYTFK